MGRSSGMQPRFHMLGVCMWSEPGIGPLPAPFPLLCRPYTFPLLFPLPPTMGTAAGNQATCSQTPMCTHSCGITVLQRLILGLLLRGEERSGREARGQELQGVGVSLHRPLWPI